jgi:type II secretion system (T2SS) protein B
MSYILDALKKAAEQRGENAPSFRRLATAPPAPGERRRAWARGGVIALCTVAAGAIAYAALRPAFVVTVAAPPKTAVVARTPAEVPPTVAVAPRAPAQAPPAVVAAPRTPAEAPRPVAVAPRASAQAPRLPAVARPAPHVVAPLISIPRAEPPSPSVPARRPPAVVVAPPAVPPVAPAAPAPAPPMRVTAAGDAKLKLEVLVYSDVASERMVFINGRKYVQGDTVGEHARVEEIQPDGVVLSDQGYRFTLRQ